MSIRLVCICAIVHPPVILTWDMVNAYMKYWTMRTLLINYRLVYFNSLGLDKMDEQLLDDRSAGNSASAIRRRVKVGFLNLWSLGVQCTYVYLCNEYLFLPRSWTLWSHYLWWYVLLSASFHNFDEKHGLVICTRILVSTQKKHSNMRAYICVFWRWKLVEKEKSAI